MQTTASQVLNLGLALPPVEREIIAHRLWESLQAPAQDEQDLPEILAEVRQRDTEMDRGFDVGRNHEDVIAAARRALECE
jgi:hypothetical protein